MWVVLQLGMCINCNEFCEKSIHIISYSLIGDRIGRLNANIIFTFGTCLSSFLVWTFAFDFPVLIAFAVLFGLFCGSYFAMSK